MRPTVLVLSLLTVYFAPWGLAYYTRNRKVWPIFWVNLLLGSVFGLGWVLAWVLLFLWWDERQGTGAVEDK